MSNYRLILSNQRISPYKLGTKDYLQAKSVLNNNEKLSYLKKLRVKLYLNITGTFLKYKEYITNEFGIVDITYPCLDLIQEISNCLGYVTTEIDSQVYRSNIVRFNFEESGFTRTFQLTLYPADIMLYSSDIITM